MEEVLALFEKVESRLREKPWFEQNNWIVAHHPFPASFPEAITLQVFKKHWFNDDTRGIHVETYLYVDPKKRKKSSVHVHLFHEDQVPGSRLKRIALTKPFVDAIEKEVMEWPGYKFRAGKYGLQPFTKSLDGKSPAFAEELEAELERICQKLGPVIDELLKNILEDRSIKSHK